MRKICRKIVNENKHSKDEIETIISEIAEDVGLNKSDISFNEQYLTYMTNPGTQERNVMIGLGLVVVFLGGMVIYSIYYVSVISNIQEMGKLKALGATKKHIRRLLFTESLIQSFVGIPCGILLGYLATVFLFRMVILSGSTLEDTFWHWQAAICVIVVVLLTVGVSIRKPLKIASGISPVEAMRYQEATGKQKRKKSYKTLSVSKLSWANIQRNKRRTVVTILALGCSGIYKGLSKLPVKQRQRIYAHFFLGMSKADIAKAEGTHKSRITRSIEAGLRSLEKYFKEIL